jgi:hypothetical protein
MRSVSLVAAMALLGLGACTMPLQTRSGLGGLPLASGGPLTVVAADQHDEPAKAATRAVAEELERRGFVIAAEAPTRVEVSLSVRSAHVSVEDGNGELISAPRNRHPFVLCDGTVHRLALTAFATERTDKPQPSQGWAEQFRCSNEPAASLAKLARMAVQALAGGTS